MTEFVSVVVMCLWAVALVALSFIALERGFDDSVWQGVMLGAAAIALFALPFGLGFFDDGDPYADRLCLSGHQEWRTEVQAPIIAGKVIVPSTTSTTKVWVCDQWARNDTKRKRG